VWASGCEIFKGRQLTIGLDLGRWGLELAARGGKRAKKAVIIAAARKLGILLHRLWVTGEVYEPLRNAQTRQMKTAAA